MISDNTQDDRVVVEGKCEPIMIVHAGFPNVLLSAHFLGVQGWMIKIEEQEFDGFFGFLLKLRGKFKKGLIERFRSANFHFPAFRLLFLISAKSLFVSYPV